MCAMTDYISKFVPFPSLGISSCLENIGPCLSDCVNTAAAGWRHRVAAASGSSSYVAAAAKKVDETHTHSQERTYYILKTDPKEEGKKVLHRSKSVYTCKNTLSMSNYGKFQMV